MCEIFKIRTQRIYTRLASTVLQFNKSEKPGHLNNQDTFTGGKVTQVTSKGDTYINY